MAKEKTNLWLTVPQFGDWEKKDGVMPDYSMDFSKIREKRKQNKRDVTRPSLGNEEEFAASASASTTTNSNIALHHHSPPVKKRLFSYFNCCVKA